MSSDTGGEIYEASLTSDYKIEEQKEVRNFQIMSKKQDIDSYDKLLDQKEISEKKASIKQFVKRIGDKIMNLHAGSGGQDRLGLTETFYQDIWEGIKTDIIFDGNVKRQYRLLELLASQEYETKPAESVRTLLEEEFPELL